MVDDSALEADAFDFDAQMADFDEMEAEAAAFDGQENVSPVSLSSGICDQCCLLMCALAETRVTRSTTSTTTYGNPFQTSFAQENVQLAPFFILFNGNRVNLV